MYGYENDYLGIKVETLRLLVEDRLGCSEEEEVEDYYRTRFTVRECEPKGERSWVVFSYKGRESEVNIREIRELDFSNLKEIVGRIVGELKVNKELA